jgi:hypothetical protein
MSEETKPSCKFMPNYNQRVLISAKCACGVKFTPPQDPKLSNESHFRDQYDKHRSERYARPTA